ncbi:NusG domain II-containing protein [Pelotomaculum propionicicum]|uniref:NusG domain II-containing protein n=1 Tax=Pelotomaculum propionicicum TaxID=258475 RepID=UPI003B7AFF3D
MALKKKHILLIALVLILASEVTTWKFVYRSNYIGDGPLFVEIRVDGDLFTRERLLMQEERKEIKVPLKSGGNAVVVIDHGSVNVPPMPKELCPLGICSRMGPISKPGRSIICMPNKMIISILSNENIL